MQNVGVAGQFGSGLTGFPIPQSRSVEEEGRLVRWLNDEWPDPGPQFAKWERGEGPMPDMPNDEDVPARRMILSEFLPRLMKVQSMPESAKEALKRGRLAMKRFPGKYANEEEAANEESGIADRARLIRMLSKHSILPTIPTRKQPAKLLARGDNMTKVWAIYVLFQMATDGVLEQLAQCDCGCGKWFIRKRRIDRFASTACRVRFHQSDPSIKEIRREKARENYHRERKGVLATGWRKERKAASHVKA